VAEGTAAVLETVLPFAAAGETLTTSVNVAVAPAASDVMVQVVVPVPPAGGWMQLNAGPAVCASETKVVLAGFVSLDDTFAASDGPLFVKVIV